MSKINISENFKLEEVNDSNFDAYALAMFHFQYQNNETYNQYCNYLKIDPQQITSINQIPFLPIQFFKTKIIKTTSFNEQLIFESSGTTGMQNSKHYLKDPSLYEQSYLNGFRNFYGHEKNWCIIGLLPSYLERKNSSLVYMVDDLIKKTNHVNSGFYLYDFDKLSDILQQNEQAKQKTLLIGVTYALLDFAEKFPQKLTYTTIMETGGMKGRRKELTRDEVHHILKNSFELPNIHSEYGMTELLSQAYSNGNGIFNCSNTMKVLIRSEDDPFEVETTTTENKKFITGGVNIIDLANKYSCSFIATDDAGKLYNKNSFEIIARLENSDIRGCGLMIAE